MIDYREIMKLHSLEFSNSAIAGSLRCSSNTVSEVFGNRHLHAPQAIELHLALCLSSPSPAEQFMVTGTVLISSSAATWAME